MREKIFVYTYSLGIKIGVHTVAGREGRETDGENIVRSSQALPQLSMRIDISEELGKS